jgi:N-acetylmuramic acid 6-phosphate etherase
MKAGTATKIILNTLTTASMIKMGKVYENLMVDLQVKNVKLKDRAERIIMTVTDLGRDAADKLLDDANGNVKTAIIMHKLQLQLSLVMLLLKLVHGTMVTTHLESLHVLKLI